MSDFRRQAAQGNVKRGDSFRFSRTFHKEDVDSFAKLTRDYNPVHSDERWCRLKGFQSPICHGLLVGSMLCEPGGQWGWLANGMTFSFVKPVYIGDTVTCEMTIVELDERCFARAACVLTNQDGQLVMEAVLSGFLPDAEARDLLGTMIAEGDPANPLGS